MLAASASRPPTPAATCCGCPPTASACSRWPTCSAPPTRRSTRTTRSPSAPPHFPPRAKRVIFLFMHGGPSQVDTFDYKPLLERDDGKPLPFGQKPRVQFAQTGNLLASPWKFKPVRPERARWVSDLFPHVARAASTTCASSTRCTATNSAPRRGAAASCTPAATRSSGPSMGSWVTYGLGTENQNLPGFITICPTLAHGGVQQLGRRLPAGRLPGHADRQRRHPGRAGADPQHRQPATRRATCSGCSSTCCSEMNREHLARSRAGPGARGPHQLLRAGLPHADGRARSCMDISGESQATLDALRHRRRPDRQLRPAVPAGPAVRRARRALHPGARTATSGTSTAT